MEQTETTATGQPERKQRSPELVRPVEGRMLAGVAQGIADNFGISEWIPRVVFIVTTFTGGLGLALYAAGWFFIRSEDEPESIADRFFAGAGTSRSWVGIGLMVLAGIIILSNLTFLSGEVIWAGAFLVVGLLLYMGYIPARGEDESDAASASKEGVQQMTTTGNREADTETLAGDSPAGGSAPPPTAPAATPPDLPPARPRERSILGRLTIGITLVGLGVLAILDNIDAVPIDAEPRHYMALAVTIVGVGLLVGSIAGRARWLILLGVIMVPTLMFSPVFELEWEADALDRRAAPTTFTGLEQNYELDVGSLEIDLRELPWDGEEVEIDARVNAGEIEILVPDGVGIVGSASVDIGDVSGLGRSRGGLGDLRLEWNEPGELGTVLLDAEVSIGQIEIRR